MCVFRSTGLQKGFTLIESLVALLVLSFSLLGLAALQLNALQSASAAYQRSLASLIALDVQERIWAASAEAAGDCGDVLDSGVEAVSNSYWSGDDYVGQETLPNLEISLASPSLCVFDIMLVWDDLRFFSQGESDVFFYRFRLPGS